MEKIELRKAAERLAAAMKKQQEAERTLASANHALIAARREVENAQEPLKKTVGRNVPDNYITLPDGEVLVVSCGEPSGGRENHFFKIVKPQ